MPRDINVLIDQLDDDVRPALEAAAGSCVQRGHDAVMPEHLLWQMLQSGRPLSRAVEQAGVPASQITAAIEQDLETVPSRATEIPMFSPTLLDWFEQAVLASSLELRGRKISPILLLLVAATGPRRVLGSAVQRSVQDIDVAALRAYIEDPGQVPTAPAESSEALERFTIDLVAEARQGRIDPVFGRESEIQQMLDILARRRKSNPLLVGDPGVGKTAVVEGLALQIARGEAPSTLEGVRILALDLGLLQAGTGIRGEFEERLKGVIQEVQQSAEPIILFIDEAHMLIGAGGEGASSAANILKPALARDLRTIAATTWKEYAKYFKDDAALARRFDLVKVPEPEPDAAVRMLRGLSSYYADSHGVHVSDEALEAAVHLSDRYIAGRLLPDKAVSLLDTCLARARNSMDVPPPSLTEARAELEHARREVASLERDASRGLSVDGSRIESLQAHIATTVDQVAFLERSWEHQRQLAQALSTAEATGDPHAIGQARAALAEAQKDDAMVAPEITPQLVGQVVSEWTGIPLGRLHASRSAALLAFESVIRDSVRGQDEAITRVGRVLRQAQAGLGAPGQPQGVFLLVGPSGVGKTHTAHAIANALYGGSRSMITINLSEFKERHTVSRLVGADPGLVGYGDGGLLTDAVLRKPHSVVLLDECEKAHRDVMQLFHQVFETGTLTDGKQQEVSFRHSVLILTSNVGSRTIASAVQADPNVTIGALQEAIADELRERFEASLVGRMTIVPYRPLTPDVLHEVVGLKLDAIAKRAHTGHGVAFTWTNDAVTEIARRCTQTTIGARDVDHILSQNVLPLLSSALLEGPSSSTALELTYAAGSGFGLAVGA